MFRLTIFITCISVAAARAQPSYPLVSKIAFGSCAEENKPQPVLQLVSTHKPDIFVYLGDNIYGDTEDMRVLKAKYDSLGNKPEYKQLKKTSRIFATWDDHDYGQNDAGKYYPYKDSSKKIFLDFFEEPEHSERRKHEGIYHAVYFQTGKRRVQLLLLDTRTFRDNLKPYNKELQEDESFFYPMEYARHDHPDSTLLGHQQWTWLEKELKKPADLRLIASGTQFGPSYNGYESWANFPHEQERMFALVRKTKANGVIFLTGDVHYGEISRVKKDSLYPVYDITSSGITSTWHFATTNSNRIEGPVMDNHFGMLTINWKQRDPRIKMEIWDVHNNQRVEYTIRLSDISFK